jgi:hypothetical protein
MIDYRLHVALDKYFSCLLLKIVCSRHIKSQKSKLFSFVFVILQVHFVYIHVTSPEIVLQIVKNFLL